MTFGTLFGNSFRAQSAGNAGNASCPDPYGYNATLDSIWFVVTYILMTCGSVVIVENLFIVMVFLSHKEFHILSNVFLASLCVADFLYASFGFYGSMVLDSAKVVSFSFSEIKKFPKYLIHFDSKNNRFHKLFVTMQTNFVFYLISDRNCHKVQIFFASCINQNILQYYIHIIFLLKYFILISPHLD